MFISFFKMHYKNVTILGTSHISQQSIELITKTFHELDPDFVLVELDRKRLAGLLSGQKPTTSLTSIKQIGLKGYLFVVVGAFIQKKLGQMVRVEPGSDMLTAVKLAQKHKKKLCLIDRDITITLHRFSKFFSNKEKWRLFCDLIMGPFSKKRINIDLQKVPSEKLILFLLTELKENYPNIYCVLVHERNVFMAKNIFNIMNMYPDSKILVVVGAGHEKEIIARIRMQTEQNQSGK